MLNIIVSIIGELPTPRNRAGFKNSPKSIDPKYIKRINFNCKKFDPKEL